MNLFQLSEKFYVLIFVIYGLLCFFLTINAAMPTIELRRKAKRLAPKYTFQQQVKQGKDLGKYIQKNKFRESKLHKILALIFFAYIFFLYYSIFNSLDDFMKYNPIASFLFAALIYTKKKSVNVYYFWREYLDNNPNNEFSIFIPTLEVAQERDKKHIFIIKFNIIFTIIFIILGFYFNLY